MNNRKTSKNKVKINDVTIERILTENEAFEKRSAPVIYEKKRYVDCAHELAENQKKYASVEALIKSCKSELKKKILSFPNTKEVRPLFGVMEGFEGDTSNPKIKKIISLYFKCNSILRLYSAKKYQEAIVEAYCLGARTMFHRLECHFSKTELGYKIGRKRNKDAKYWADMLECEYLKQPVKEGERSKKTHCYAHVSERYEIETGNELNCGSGYKRLKRWWEKYYPTRFMEK